MKFRVKAPFTHADVKYKTGDVFETDSPRTIERGLRAGVLAESGNKPDFVPQQHAQKKEKTAGSFTLEEALADLDHGNDLHWTRTGLPDLNVIKELTGQLVTRKALNEAHPDIVRK
jgi:hypothetical protein